jgi:hypothetical protein
MLCRSRPPPRGRKPGTPTEKKHPIDQNVQAFTQTTIDGMRSAYNPNCFIGGRWLQGVLMTMLKW